MSLSERGLAPICNAIWWRDPVWGKGSSATVALDRELINDIAIVNSNHAADTVRP